MVHIIRICKSENLHLIHTFKYMHDIFVPNTMYFWVSDLRTKGKYDLNLNYITRYKLSITPLVVCYSLSHPSLTMALHDCSFLFRNHSMLWITFVFKFDINVLGLTYIMKPFFLELPYAIACIQVHEGTTPRWTSLHERWAFY
jgi:hypothetical protein